MKKHSLAAMLLMSLVMGGSAAHAEDPLMPQKNPQDPLNLNNSEYPVSNQQTPTPSEPEIHSQKRSVYKTPDGAPPLNQDSTAPHTEQ